jgi:hypothetical protein
MPVNGSRGTRQRCCACRYTFLGGRAIRSTPSTVQHAAVHVLFSTRAHRHTRRRARWEVSCVRWAGVPAGSHDVGRALPVPDGGWSLSATFLCIRTEAMWVWTPPPPPSVVTLRSSMLRILLLLAVLRIFLLRARSPSPMQTRAGQPCTKRRT